MTEINSKHKIECCQGDWQSYYEAVRARVAAEGYQTPSVSPDDEPSTLKELVFSLWNELETKLENKSLDEKLETEHLLEIIPIIPEFEKLRKELDKELHREPPTFADVVMEFLKSPPAIAGKLNAIHEGIDSLCGLGERIAEGQDKQIELWEETNRYLKAIVRYLEEPPEDTSRGSRPFKPPPTDRGGKYVRL